MIIHQISLSKAYPSNLYFKSQNLKQEINIGKKIFKESSGHQRKVKVRFFFHLTRKFLPMARYELV